MIVATMDILDLEGSQRMYRDLYQPFEKKTLIVINKTMPHDIFSEHPIIQSKITATIVPVLLRRKNNIKPSYNEGLKKINYYWRSHEP
jgi:hypothetical protein